MTFTRALAVVLALVLPSYAWGAISLSLAPSYDLVRYTTYPNGDKPVAGCSTPSGWTEADIGDGGGEVCDSSGDWEFSVLGTTFRQNAHLIYKDAGAADVQFEATVANDYAGVTGNNAGLGIGLREDATSASYIFQIHVLNTGTNIVECTYGANGTYTTVDGPASLTRPQDLGVTYDVSSGDLKAFQGGLEVCTQNRAMSDVLAYGVGQSKSITETLSATLENPTLGTTIDLYTPSDPGGGSPPVLVSAIPNQTGTQGSAFSLDYSSYFTGETSYSLGSAMPGALTLNTSTGVVSGTPNATDVSSSPYSRNLCAVNSDGTTCDSVQFDFSASTGTTHVSADVSDSTKTTINCNTFDGGVDPGDTIEFTSGSRGAVELQNCHGNANNYIKLRKSASATRLTITGQGDSSDAFLCRNCSYVDYDFSVNWTGHTDGCGVDSTLSETPLTDCGLLIDATNQFGLKFRGEARFINIKGIEVDGNWPAASDFGGCHVADLSGCSAAQLATTNGMDTSISPNDQSYCVTTGSEWREGFVVERNYFHHLANEIVYFGPNVNYGNCGTGKDPPRLRNITLRYNYTRFGAWDGWNLKSAYAGTNNIDHNVVLDIGGGTTGSGANSVGISCFESECNIFNNKIRRTSDPPGGANGITCSANQAPSSWGTLDCQVYGNDVSDTDGNCININRGASADADRSATVYNNTVTDCGGSGINVDSKVTGGVTVRDNIAAGESVNVPTGNGNVKTNNNTTAEASIGFVDHANDDYRITSGSSARNAGSSGCPNEDLLGTSRPQGSQCDQGAYEYDE